MPTGVIDDEHARRFVSNRRRERIDSPGSQSEGTMNIYKHKLTDTEIACGVTLEQVARELPRVLLRDDRVHVDGTVPPALGSSVARAAFGSDEFRFVGLGAQTGFLIYERK